MDTARYCQHRRTAPVTSLGGTVVARLCLGCDTQMSAAWGCPACEWDSADITTLADTHTVEDYYLRRACPRHEVHR